METTNRLRKGPKYFVTLDVVPCYKDNEFERGPYTLHNDLDWDTKNAHYLINGDLYFELWDEQGYIGFYIVSKQFLHLIKPLSKKEWLELER
jgi:hypothetical protein